MTTVRPVSIPNFAPIVEGGDVAQSLAVRELLEGHGRKLGRTAKRARTIGDAAELFCQSAKRFARRERHDPAKTRLPAYIADHRTKRGSLRKKTFPRSCRKHVNNCICRVADQKVMQVRSESCRTLLVLKDCQ